MINIIIESSNIEDKSKISNAEWPATLPACPQKGDMVVSLDKDPIFVTVQNIIHSINTIYLSVYLGKPK